MKQEILEKLFEYAQSLGVTSQEAFVYFEAKAKEEKGYTLHQDDKNAKLNDKLLPCSGMFCYEDNSFSFELRDDKIVKGIIVYVAGPRFLAVCLEEKRLPWSTSGLKVGENPRELYGALATQNILQKAKECHQSAEAAEWCNVFVQNGVKSGEAFLPSTYELIKISDNQEQINRSLKELNLVSLSGWYWSANEKDEDTAILVRLSDGKENVFSKRRIGGFVRPVFWVEM